MLARITLTLFAFVLLHGCCATQPRPATAPPPVVVTPPDEELAPRTSTVGIVTPLEREVQPLKDGPIEFDAPVLLVVDYPAPDGQGRSSFNAIAIALNVGETFSLEMIDGLLVIKDGAIYVTGTRPAVGGGQTGTVGDGTQFILEARGGHEFLFLLGGKHVDVFRRRAGEPVLINPLNRFSMVHHYRKYRWPNDVASPDLPRRIANADEQQEKIYERLSELAAEAGLPFPPLDQ